MALSEGITGSVENSDLISIRVNRTGEDGTDLAATVEYRVINAQGNAETRHAGWTLTAGEKSALQALLPSAKTAIEDDLGL